MLTLFSSGIHDVKSSITAAQGSQIFFTLWSSGLRCFVTATRCHNQWKTMCIFTVAKISDLAYIECSCTFRVNN